MPLTHAILKAKQRELRAGFPETMGLRVHRSLSWIGRAEQATDDDGRFIFLWIAFNAAYADEEELQNAAAGERAAWPLCGASTGRARHAGRGGRRRAVGRRGAEGRAAPYRLSNRHALALARGGKLIRRFPRVHRHPEAQRFRTCTAIRSRIHREDLETPGSRTDARTARVPRPCSLPGYPAGRTD